MPGSAIATLAALHAVYFLITGIWPIVHMPSFLAVTGPKNDLWLVRTVGALVTAIGAAIAVAAYQRELGASTFVLAAGSAAALATIDIVYVAKRVIPPIYLLDAVAEIALLLAWVLLWVG